MKLSDQVVSLGLAKRLAKLGVEEKSLFRWFEHFNGYGAQVQIEIKYGFFDFEKTNSGVYHAYTSSELAQMLPPTIDNSSLEIVKTKLGYVAEYLGVFYTDSDSLTLADCLAEMLIQVLKK